MVTLPAGNGGADIRPIMVSIIRDVASVKFGQHGYGIFLFHQYMRVVETKKPLLFDTRYEYIEQANYLLRLPLSNDGEQLTSILGLANRRDVTAPMRHWVDKQ